MPKIWKDIPPWAVLLKASIRTGNPENWTDKDANDFFSELIGTVQIDYADFERLLEREHATKTK